MRHLYTLLLLLSPLCALGQSELTGRVTGTDAPDGLPGASVQVVGTPRGVVTGFDGRYTLPLQEGDSAIRISFVGYQAQTIAIEGRGQIDVALSTDNRLQEEVVVVGYGTQRRSDLTGAVSSLRGEALTAVPSNNPLQALQGRVSGVQVASPSGNPGEAPVVRVRGVGTFGAGNSPLFVVDGAFVQDISNIAPQDIESMEVLKDASAAAIYGVFGANGVILITTKRGREGRPLINVSLESGVQTIPRYIPLLSGRQFGELTNEIGVTQFNNLDRLANTDWQREVFRPTSPIQNYQFSISGGSALGSTFFSVGYFRQDGIVPNSYFDRVTIRSNNSLNIRPWWSVGNNLTLSPSTQRNVPAVFLTAYRADPTIPVRNDTTSAYSEVPTFGNPVADLEYNSYNFNRTLSGVGNLFTEFKLPAGFRLRANYGFDLRHNRGQAFTPIFFVSPAQSSTITRLNTSRFAQANTVLDFLAYWTRSFGRHNLDAVVGNSYVNQFSINLSVAGQQLLAGDPSGYYLNTGVVPANSASEGGFLARVNSVFGRLNYNYDGRYLATATLRSDASSLFSANNRVGYFPSAALGWVVSREAFMQNVGALTNLKLRASAGQLGNQAAGFNAGFQNTRFNLINAQTPVVLGAGDVFLQGASLGAVSNPNLRWETTTSYNAGFELGLLENRLTLEADYYHRTTRDILVPLPLPLFAGSQSPTLLVNAGSVRNTGIEFNINWRDQIGQVGYRLGALGTTVNNEVLSLGAIGQAGGAISNGGVEGSFLTRTVVGQPIGTFFGYAFDGIFQNIDEVNASPRLANSQPGDVRFRDVNGDGQISPDDRVFLGSPIPRFIFGFSLGANYRNFDLQADFQGQTGNYVYNAKEVVRPGLANFEARWADRWRADNPSNTVPRATVSGNNFLPSELFLQRGDFLRLRTLTLSYTLPAALTTRLQVGGVSVFVRGTNLFTLTQFTGYSPEIGGSDPTNTGIDLGIYPITRVLTGGLNLTF